MKIESTRRTPIHFVLSALGGLASVFIVGILPVACQSGGIGDPCIPEDEYGAEFSGYDVAEEYIESRSFQCQSRICLVNHFQGRVSCPLGQPPPQSCTSPEDTSCGEGRQCVESASISPSCTYGGGAAQCEGFGSCDVASGFCACTATTDCPEGAHCDPASRRCKRYVCHTPGSCQNPVADEAANRGKSCCVPGTDTPVAVPVCGQCSDSSGRSADTAVYCSCRCGPPDGKAPDPDANYCDCPSGFECAEIRKDFDLGDEQLTGKYCIKQGSRFQNDAICGEVNDYFDPKQCKGIPTSGS